MIGYWDCLKVCTRFFLVIFLCATLSACGGGSHGTAGLGERVLTSGVVTDEAKRPIADASVIDALSAVSTQTNVNGEFEIELTAAHDQAALTIDVEGSSDTLILPLGGVSPEEISRIELVLSFSVAKESIELISVNIELNGQSASAALQNDPVADSSASTNVSEPASNGSKKKPGAVPMTTMEETAPHPAGSVLDDIVEKVVPSEPETSAGEEATDSDSSGSAPTASDSASDQDGKTAGSNVSGGRSNGNSGGIGAFK